MDAREHFEALMQPGHVAPDPFDLVATFLRRPAWMKRAACAGMGTDQFFPRRGEDPADAKSICAGCQVRQECLEFAVTVDVAGHGIWGGVSPRQRARMRREQPREPVPCIHCAEPASPAATTGLCRRCSTYRARFGGLPDAAALEVRRERRTRKAADPIEPAA